MNESNLLPPRSKKVGLRFFHLHNVSTVYMMPKVVTHARALSHVAHCQSNTHTLLSLSHSQVHRYSYIRRDICLPLSASVFFPESCRRVSMPEHWVVLPGRQSAASEEHCTFTCTYHWVVIFLDQEMLEDGDWFHRCIECMRLSFGSCSLYASTNALKNLKRFV